MKVSTLVSKYYVVSRPLTIADGADEGRGDGGDGRDRVGVHEPDLPRGTRGRLDVSE